MIIHLPGYIPVLPAIVDKYTLSEYIFQAAAIWQATASWISLEDPCAFSGRIYSFVKSDNISADALTQTFHKQTGSLKSN